MKNTKCIFRLLCLLLAMATIVGCAISFASCKKDPVTEETPTSAKTDANTAAPGSEEELYRPGDVDFEDYEYKLLVTENSFGQSVFMYDSDETPREVCDYALWCRQNLMEERHGLTMSLIIEQQDKAHELLGTAVLSNIQDYCQGAAFYGTEWAALAANGYLYDLNQMDELNLEASYWDQRIQTEFDINGHLFALEGEWHVKDDLTTIIALYNDTAYESMGYDEKYGTPYQLVKDGKWTYDVMMSMIKDTWQDLDGDGEHGTGDFWGLVTETPAPYYFFLGSGQKYITNKGGELAFASEDNTIWQTNYNILEDVMSLATNENVIVIDRDAVGEGDVWSIASNIFSTNHALFRTTALSGALRLIDMEDDYGILPLPKYTEAQEGYYCMTSGEPFMMPVCVSDPGKSALAIEMISYYSLYMGGDSLNYAFYDLLAFARLCRNADDVNMLKVVFASKTYDLERATQLSSIKDITTNMCKNKNYSNLFSDIDETKDSTIQKIQDYVVNIESKLKRA